MKLVTPNLGAMARRRQWLIPMIVGAIVTMASLAAYLSKPQFIEDVSNLFTDHLQRIHPRPYDPNLPVRIVDIDDESIRRIGQWPWPRTVMAELNNRLAESDASVIAYDIIFSEKDRTSPENMIDTLEGNPAARGSFENISVLKSHDSIFAESFSRTRVIAGFFLVNNPTESLPPPKYGIAIMGETPAESLEEYLGALYALPELHQAAAGAGHVSFKADGDGVVRAAPLMGRIGDQLFPSLSVEALRAAQDISTYKIKSSSGNGEWGSFRDNKQSMAALQVGQFEIPTTPDGRILVHYSQSSDERFIPAWKVLSDDPNDQDWQGYIFGNIVFVGTSSEGLKDIVTTPIKGGEPGVLVHAQVVEQALQGDYLYKPYWITQIEWAGLFFMGVMLTLILPRLTAIRGLILLLALGNTIYWTALYAFKQYNLLIDPVYPLLALATSYVLITLTSFYVTESERSRIRGAFSLYLSPDMVKELSENPELLALGGVEREISILFLDIRAFSKISESMRPQDITNFLNKFLTPMTDILQKYEATIDKYIGDAIVAFWNAPIDDPEHQKNAARAVLDMQKKLANLNAEYRNHKEIRWPDNVSIGVGVNTGICCVGNLGSEQRFSYSMIGDAANLASRIEGLTKQYGLSNLIGTATVKDLEGFAVLDADIVSVVGRQAPERIHMLVGDEKVADSTDFLKLQKTHSAFIAAYRDREWSEAKVLAKEASNLATKFDLHRYYAVMRERVKLYEKTPPPEDWGGIYKADTK